MGCGLSLHSIDKSVFRELQIWNWYISSDIFADFMCFILICIWIHCNKLLNSFDETWLGHRIKWRNVDFCSFLRRCINCPFKLFGRSIHENTPFSLERFTISLIHSLSLSAFTPLPLFNFLKHSFDNVWRSRLVVAASHYHLFEFGFEILYDILGMKVRNNLIMLGVKEYRRDRGAKWSCKVNQKWRVVCRCYRWVKQSLKWLLNVGKRNVNNERRDR